MIKLCTKLYTIIGIVNKRLPNTMFRIKLINENRFIVCYLCGKLRINYVKIVVGDKVKVEIDNSNINKGRIISRLI